jgi:hypothetical protein
MHDQRDRRKQQQDVNQGAGDVKNQEAPKPQEKQNNKQNDEHLASFASSRGKSGY